MKISIEQDGKRLDQAFTETMGSLSRAQVQKKIKAGLVRLNGKVAVASTRVRTGDEIEVAEGEPTAADAGAQERPSYTLIDQQADWLVIEKPSGVVIHPASGFRGVSLSEVLLEDFPELRGVGEDASRPGIVHRLDRDVSGVLLVARTSKAYEVFKREFKEGKAEKVYLGLVHGVVLQSSGVIDFSIARSRIDRHKMAARADGEGRASVTEFEVLQSFQQFTYLKLRPRTGRTHQLRVHLNAINHPLVGDTVYHPRKWKVQADLGRIFLHAHQLTIGCPDGERRTFVSPLPPKLKAFLDHLK